MQSRRITSSLVGAALIGLLAQTADTQQQNAATATDWPSYRHDESGTGHSPLRQINAGNVASLIRVWTYSLQGEASAAPNARERWGSRRCELTGDTHRGERRHVSPGCESGGRA